MDVYVNCWMHNTCKFDKSAVQNMEKPLPFVFLFLLHCFLSCLAWTQTNITTDISALFCVKSHITSDPYNFLANWSVSSSPCSWVGVTCNTRHGRVHSLNLGGMDLEGSISPQLGNLSFLVDLDLSNNNFHGQIPQDLVQLRRLRLFNLSYNDFHGQVPTWIGDLSMLEQLSFQSNSLNGFIPLSLFNLSRLETLDWNSNKLSGAIPQTISNLSSLELLDLSYNSLSGCDWLLCRL
ncbi:LRR receptor-like serine/threonine-protein kinase EFR [Neltuma alba]|uniref:LRR receptor-like serine/threonine-protein kinase EFR n=1 Tax=Neltuma alba TaxID=207710 RepID=UPI0010A3899F|nr:LRR receptor-like serine/threonine-protein kinase EFR [Prosopis alba]